MKTQNWFTGGNEYYIIFTNGTHELREVTNDETGDYEIAFTGHYEKCIEKMKSIIADNVEYDLNL